MSETQAGKFVKFLVPLLTTRRGHRGVGQYAYCLECKFKKTLNIIFHQVDKVRNLFGVSVHCNAKIDKVLPTLPTADPKTVWRRFASSCRLAPRGPPCPETQPSLLHNRSKVVFRQKKFSSEAFSSILIENSNRFCNWPNNLRLWSQFFKSRFFSHRFWWPSCTTVTFKAHHTISLSVSNINLTKDNLTISQQEGSVTQSHERLLTERYWTSCQKQGWPYDYSKCLFSH